MARELRQGVSSLEATTHAALGILALASGVYTYIGVRGLLDGDSLLMSGGALVYSAAVSVAIYVFWAYSMKFLPMLRTAGSRLGMLAVMAVGCGAIVAMSSWLNAAALAGSAAVEQHLAQTVEDYQGRLELAHENALAAQSLLPDVRLAEQRFRDLAQAEAQSGALTGTSGIGTVVELLNQSADQLDDLGGQIADARPGVEQLFDTGGQHLAVMREMVASAGPIAERSLVFAEQAVDLSGVITDLQQSSIAPAVRRQAEDLARSFIAPAPDGASVGLAERQSQVVVSVRAAIETSSAALVAAATEIINRPPAQPPRFTPLSTPEAVLMYAGDFVPSWAGAIAIDLLPLVLVLILMIVHTAIRHREGDRDQAEQVSVAELTLALSALQRLHAVAPPPAAYQPAPPHAPEAPQTPQPSQTPQPPEAPDAPSAQVRPLKVNRRDRDEG